MINQDLKLAQLVPFTTEIFFAHLPSEDISSDIKKLAETIPSSVISNQGGWQSPSYDFSSNIFAVSLLTKIKVYVDAVYSHMGVRGGNSTLCNYWFNINKRYSYNNMHSHPDGYFSAVFYVKVPKNSGNIVFRRNDGLREHIVFDNTYEHNAGEYVITPHINNLIIFPSFLDHYVQQNLTEDEDDERISIAINFR